MNGNKPGFIQFVGETQFAPGQWAGIVLDEPIGKNDGSVAGVRYFKCEPLKGIFTRPLKLSKVQAEAEADGPQTTHASWATSPPSTSAVSVASLSPATPSNIPHKSSQATVAFSYISDQQPYENHQRIYLQPFRGRLNQERREKTQSQRPSIAKCSNLPRSSC